MSSPSNLCTASLCVLAALLLASCGGSPSNSTTTGGGGGGSTPSFALTVTAPASGAGTITSNPTGINCPGTCSATFTQATKVSLAETPGANYFFGGWGGSCSGTSTCTVTMSAAETVSATFNAGVSLTVAESGTGSITSTPAGIACPGTCSASFAPNTQITLTATPGSSYFFGGWTGSCSGTSTCTVTVSAAETVNATFNAGAGLSVAESGTGTGTVTSAPAGISCPGTCSAIFAPNTQVTLTATPNSSFSFGGWGGNCSGTSACTLTLNTSESVSATFNGSNSLGLIVSLAGAGAGAVTSTPAGINCSATSTACSASFASGTQVTLTATPVTTNSFAGWSGACTGTTTCSVTVNAASNVTATFGGSLQTNINHIILFAQENRSFDHYFGYMRQYWANNGIPDQSFDGLPQFNPVSGIPPLQGPVPSVPGCNLANSATECTPDPTNPISSFSFHGLSVCQENQSPFWNEAHNSWDYTDPSAVTQNTTNPPLNGYVFTAAYDARSNGLQDVNGVRVMGYYEDTDLNYYYFMATNFGTSDRWFSPIMSRTQLNRMYMMAATSQGYVYPIGSNTNDATVLTAKPIFQELQDAGITWKIYVDPTNVSDANGACSTTAVSDANGMCLIAASYINMFAYESTIINSAGKTPDLLLNIVPIGQFAQDAAAGTLPQFALIEPASNAGLDEHPSDTDQYPVNVQDGAIYASGLINTLMQSKSWTDSALIFTYDESGDLYDHVPPQPAASPGDVAAPIDLETGDICDSANTDGGQLCNFGWTGYRVPTIVISPYSIKNFVSHTVRDTTSVLSMVEARFGVAALTGRDAAQPSMNEFFDFVNKPWAAPPTPPTQNTGEACTQTPPASWNEPPLLTVVVSGTGGTVASSPAGIDNCASTGGACSAPYASGTAVTLTATPATGATFTGWSGAGCSGTSTCSVTVTGATSVSATFTP